MLPTQRKGQTLPSAEWAGQESVGKASLVSRGVAEEALFHLGTAQPCPACVSRSNHCIHGVCFSSTWVLFVPSLWVRPAIWSQSKSFCCSSVGWSVFSFFFFSSYFLALHYDYGLTSVLKLVVNYLAGVARWQIEKWEYKVVILTWLDMEFQE